MTEMTLPSARSPIRAMPLRVMRDETLARLAASGDRAAFGQIFERYHQPLYRYCLSILRDPEDAADTLQAVMARALKALDGEPRAIDLKPWLYRIAHNESIGLIRTRSRRVVVGLAEEVAANPDRGPEGQFFAKQRLTQLVEDMAELPARQRGALTMRELNGLAYAEIAAALEISEPAARQSVYEARKMLFEFADGRDLSCEDVRRQVSEHDKGFPRDRGVRAHLRSCSGCQGFRSAIGTRRSDLHALSPALAAPAAAALLQGVLGTGASSLSGGGGLAAVLGAGGAQGAAGSLAIKGAAVLAAASIAAGGAVVLDEENRAGDRSPAQGPGPNPQGDRSGAAGHGDEDSPAARRKGRVWAAPRHDKGGGSHRAGEDRRHSGSAGPSGGSRPDDGERRDTSGSAGAVENDNRGHAVEAVEGVEPEDRDEHGGSASSGSRHSDSETDTDTEIDDDGDGGPSGAESAGNGEDDRSGGGSSDFDSGGDDDGDSSGPGGSSGDEPDTADKAQAEDSGGSGPEEPSLDD